MNKKLSATLIKGLQPTAKPYEIMDSEIKGFLLRVQPSGVMSYYLAYRNQAGKKHRYRIGRQDILSPTQAREIAKRLAGEVAKGIDIQQAKKQQVADAARQKSKYSLKSFIDKVFKEWCESHRERSHQTVTRLHTCFDKEFGDRYLDTINQWMVEKWRSKRVKENIKATTINRDVANLQAVFSRAVEWGFVESHPLKELIALKESGDKRVRFLSEDEEKALRGALNTREIKLRQARHSANQWRKARGYDLWPEIENDQFADHVKPMVLLAINTGVRRGELFKLIWNDVDISNATLKVIGKGKKLRYVPLNSEAIDVLKSWLKQRVDNNPFVFPNSEGEPFNNIRKAYNKVLGDAKIEEFRFHDLRHHFASKLIMAGVDLNTVRELLGHADIKMTLRYAHLAPEHKARAVEKLVRSCNE